MTILAVMSLLGYAMLALVVALVAFCVAFRVCLRARPSRASASATIGFFHPYCHAGGGGERVLWVAVAGLQQWARARRIALEVVVYTGDAEPAEEILGRAKERFSVALEGASAFCRVTFARIRTRGLLEAVRYPRLTLLGQSLGSMVCAAECLLRAGVDVWVDTTGAAFTLPLAALLGGARTAAYVHYPTVSTDMLNAVAERQAAFNNASTIASSPLLTALKLGYYRAFAAAYGCAGRTASPRAVMTNSSWTQDHIAHLWGGAYGAVVYPPCPTEALCAAGAAHASPAQRARRIVSLAQFRPEKNHALQLEAFALFRSRHGAAAKGVVLELMGGVRDAGDEERFAALKQLAHAGLGLPPSAVAFTANPSFTYVQGRLATSLAAIHTMAREHFGISCVEAQAAGCVLIAHDSGGPKTDIVVPAWRPGGREDALGGRQGAASPAAGKGRAGSKGRAGRHSPGKQQQQQQQQQQRSPAPYFTGCLATSVEEYAEALAAVFEGNRFDVGRAAQAGRAACERFSEEAFCKGFLEAVAPLLEQVAGQ